MPLAIVVSRVPPRIVTESMAVAPSHMSSNALGTCGATMPAAAHTLTTTPPAMSVRYAPVISQYVSHLPSTIAARSIGFDASV